MASTEKIKLRTNKFEENKVIRSREWFLERLPLIFTRAYLNYEEADDTMWWLIAYEDEISDHIYDIKMDLCLGGTNIEYAFTNILAMIAYWNMLPEEYNRFGVPLTRWDLSWMYPMSSVGVTTEAIKILFAPGYIFLTPTAVSMVMHQIDSGAAKIKKRRHSNPVVEVLSMDEGYDFPHVECFDTPVHVDDVVSYDIDHIYTPIDFGLVVPFSSLEVAWMNFAAFRDWFHPFLGVGAYDHWLGNAFSLVKSLPREEWCADHDLPFMGIYDDMSVRNAWVHATRPSSKLRDPSSLMLISGMFVVAWWESSLKKDYEILQSMAYGILKSYALGGKPRCIPVAMGYGMRPEKWVLPSADIIPLFDKCFKTQLPSIGATGRGGTNRLVSVDALTVCIDTGDGLCVPTLYSEVLDHIDFYGCVLNLHGDYDAITLVSDVYDHDVVISKLPLGRVWKPPMLPLHCLREDHNMWTTVSLLDIIRGSIPDLWSGSRIPP